MDLLTFDKACIEGGNLNARFHDMLILFFFMTDWYILESVI